MILYKRNSAGHPIFWSIEKGDYCIKIHHGLVGKSGTKQIIQVTKDIRSEINSMVNAKFKEGYKKLSQLYDNAPDTIESDNLLHYLNTYLPKHNTHGDGNFIPMLCKTLKDNKPFEKGNYFGQWKINGERCIITAFKTDDLFQDIKFNYRSREGVDWTNKLSYLDEYLKKYIKGDILDMMIEEGVGLDGELYLPGYKINMINHFIKDTTCPEHYKLQFWCYDICVDDVAAKDRYRILQKHLAGTAYPLIQSLDDHLKQDSRMVLLPITTVENITKAINLRDKYTSLGFEGLIVREENALYQFGGKRNNSMLKYKPIEDGYFKIIAIKEDKRGLPVFTLQNDINLETFDATFNGTYDVQKFHLSVANSLIGKTALVEYRERSGVKEVPFHSKIIKIIL